MKNNFYECEKEVLDLYLNAEVFDKKRTFTVLNNSPDHRLNRNHENIHGIELIIRPECNQKCEYCYIARYGDELYPHNERVKNDVILKNIDILLDYIYNTKKVYWEHFELFAGDMFYDDLFFDILDVFYKHLKPLSEKYPKIFEANEGLILSPTNFSFITDEEKCKKVDMYIQKFREFNWDIGLSISTDGKYAVDTREQRPLDDEYFEKLFNFTLKYPRVGFHPILSASNIHNSIKNYEWWRDMYKKYYFNETDKTWAYNNDFLPYWLEARNDEWTKETIKAFCDLMDYMVKDRLVMCDNDSEKLAYHVFVGDGKNGTLKHMHHSDIIDIALNINNASYEVVGCSLSGLFCVNIGNLELSPCHRLTYHQFRGGKFIVDNDKIVDIIPKNVFGFINTVTTPAGALPQCEKCLYGHICTKGCLGAQYEATGELFQPCLTVCDLLKTYHGYLVNLYFELGVIDIAHQKHWISEVEYKVYSAIQQDYLQRVEHEKRKEMRFA